MIASSRKCWVDGPPPVNRVLNDTNVNVCSTTLSKEYCAQLCSDLGPALTIAGVESGGECYCGRSIRSGASSAPLTDCNNPCRGRENETCGGNWRLETFNFQCGLDPQHPVRPPAGPLLNPRLVNPCLDSAKPFHSQPWCDANLGIESRISDFLSRMTDTEKVLNLGTGGASVPSLDLPYYGWGNEATHGVAGFQACPPTKQMTNFPFPITTAMSFNRSLWKATGARIGREARAAMNAGNAYSTFWAPVINLAREPRWCVCLCMLT